EMTARKCERIAELLQQQLADGYTLSDDILFFADSTYGLGAADLAGALTDPDFEDKDIILGLVIYPDSCMRRAIEEIIGDSIFTSGDEKTVFETLAGDEKPVLFRIPGAEVSFQVPLSRGLSAFLVEKLYLTRTLDRQICAALHKHLPAPCAQSARILLRCRGDLFSGTSRRFLCTLIEKAADRRHDFAELFELSLILLAERPDDIAAEAYFLDRKRVLADTLKNIRDFEKKRDHYGMEYLLMQRYQVPHESEEAVLQRLELLSAITDELLRLLPPATQCVRQLDLGGFDPKQHKDLDTLFKRLS
ncbi:MAG: hypothetical protein IH612_01100, partial [Desulfofustis sp.]|nr:hypothetical protein [Desulfofustis sp.]